MFGPDDFEVQIQQENPPGIHAEPSIPPAQDEEYGDFIVKHGQNMGGKFLPVKFLRSSSESNDHCGEIKESKILSEKILPVSATGTGISGRRHYAGDFFCSEDGTRDGNAGFRLSGTWHQSERTCW